MGNDWRHERSDRLTLEQRDNQIIPKPESAMALIYLFFKMNSLIESEAETIDLR
jgi:hypothetical protein